MHPRARKVQVINTPLATAESLQTASVITQICSPAPVLIAAQQSKPMNHAVLILLDIGWLQFAPSPRLHDGPGNR
jgi:hypothetical protein